MSIENIQSRWGFGTLLGGFRKGYATKSDSAKNDRFWDTIFMSKNTYDYENGV